MASVELLEWLSVKKELKAMKGGKKKWGPANLEQDRHKEGEFPRIASFEVFVLSTVKTDKGKQTVIHEAYSKLHSNRWPIINILVHKIVKTLARIKKRDSGVPGEAPQRCSTSFLEPIGKVFDCHSHHTVSKSLFIPSMRCWVHPEVDGELLSTEFVPDGQRPMQLCEVTPGMRVRAVNLRLSELKYSHAKEVAAYVSRTTSVNTLSLRDNDIDGQGATHFAKAVAHNPSVTSVDLRNNRIGPEGATAFAEILRNSTSLKQLNLYSNKMGQTGAEELAKALRRNHTLTCLDLGDNLVGDIGSTKIANALHANTALTSLQIQPLNDLHPGSSGMGDPRNSSGSVALVTALKDNAAIHTLNVGASSILSQWDSDAGAFPHKMMTPSLWKGKVSVPASVLAAGGVLPCTRTKLLQKPKDLRNAVVPKGHQNEEEDTKKPLLATEYAAKRRAAFNVHEGKLWEEILGVHQISLESLSLKGPRVASVGPR
eukprot:CAMPEP_0180347502 /NCGR_PEP_ID=MMETSP0989-20121125/4432_1 /TAXON_ID=697907 /ORGANISM="non described non described, Strain CCMP2293" /LENGTH=484 /DNA_ID=CAMNT_0022336687 /DNA_START=372 /DNA_END=1826 /DNA_ORIENTATION=+